MENIADWEIGDILVAQWGYSMTLVQYFQIVDSTWKMVKVVEIGCRNTHEESDPFTGYVMPVPSEKIKHAGRIEILHRKIIENGQNPYIQINESANAYLWDGKSTYFDHLD